MPELVLEDVVPLAPVAVPEPVVLELVAVALPPPPIVAEVPLEQAVMDAIAIDESQRRLM